MHVLHKYLQPPADLSQPPLANRETAAEGSRVVGKAMAACDAIVSLFLLQESERILVERCTCLMGLLLGAGGAVSRQSWIRSTKK